MALARRPPPPGPRRWGSSTPTGTRALTSAPGRAENAHRPAEVSRPATEETWVTSPHGEPVFMVVAEPSDSLAGELRRLLPSCGRSWARAGG